MLSGSVVDVVVVVGSVDVEATDGGVRVAADGAMRCALDSHPLAVATTAAATNGSTNLHATAESVRQTAPVSPAERCPYAGRPDVERQS
jgi:hypothetical protein